MTMKEQGTAKYGRLIRQNIEQAQYLAGIVAESPVLELALPVSLNVVNFRYTRPGYSDERLDAVNKEIETELPGTGNRSPLDCEHTGTQVPACSGYQPPEPAGGFSSSCPGGHQAWNELS